MVGSQINQYKIQEKIGSGGQGTVYKALDTKLNRTVVIKILPPELTQKTANFKRFEREAQLCSQLDHPNICTIYDFNEANGVFYIAMQYVEGKNVRQLVAGRPLELRSALSIAIQVTDALAYAHSKNIIHRDIKAGNVMVTPGGQVKILDFGLAKLLEDEHVSEEGVDRTEITELGIPYGTATYAAPEQAKGERADARSDIFSTGVLIYEMLTGIWAFQGKTVIDVRHQVLYGTPKALGDMRTDALPPGLQPIVDKALQKDPKNRYQKISVMRDDLRGILQQIAGAPLMAGDTFVPSHVDSGVFKRALNWFTGKSAPEMTSAPFTPSVSNPPSSAPDMTVTSTGTEKKSVAILPFTNLSQEEGANFYEFALADAVITELAQLRSLIVRPSSVIAKYHGKAVDPREAGRELRVHAVLSASFLKSGDKLRVTAQLLDVLTGEILWSDRIDAEGSDILTLQDGIAQRILEGLRLELSDNEQEKLGRRLTDNAEAWEEYLRGRDSFGRFIFRTLNEEDCNAAIENFKKAIELDTHFALAYSGLGACYANRFFKGLGEPDDYTLAETAFSKAFFYDPNVVEARVLMTMIYMARGEKKKARAEIELLQKQFPNEAPLYFMKGVINRLDGNYEESLKAFEKLSRLDPAARAVCAYNRARIFIYKRDYDQAIREIERGEKAEPDHPMLKIFRSGVYYYRGDKQMAIDLMGKVLDDHPEMDGIRPLYAIYLAGSGREEEARAQLSDDALALAKSDHDMAYWVASTYALLGDKDLAFKWLNRAVKLGNQNKPHFEHDKSLDTLRDDPRFAELMAKVSNGE
jgi:eukaryotic-like serine/threonine-protein kinase